MKRFAPLPSLVMVFSLFLVLAIWLTPASAANPAPVLTSLGQLRLEGEVTMGTPSAMDMDAAGNLYVADASMRKIFRFDPYGNLARVYSDAAFKFPDNRGLTSGRGLAVTPDGKQLYVAREPAVGIGQVLILDTATGAVVGELIGSGDVPEFKLTGEIDLDADGNVYVADAGPGRMTVKIYSKAGQFKTKFGGVGNATGLFQAINSMTVDNATGRVVVADPSPSSLGGKVAIFTLDPLTLQVDATKTIVLNKSTQFGKGPVEAPANSGNFALNASELHTPKGIAFDSLGRGYFLEYMFSDVRILDSAANNYAYLATFWNTGFDQGQLAYVSDAVYDAANKRLFVSCDGGRVEIFGVDGGSNPVRRNTPPTTPVTQSPVAGSVVATATPTLAYTAEDDKDVALLKYQVVVKQGATVTFASDWVAATSITVPALEENGSYTWTAQAVDVEGELSPVSAAAAFVVNAVDEAPSAPVLQTELAGNALAGERLFFWSAAVDADPNDAVRQYLVELASDAGFTDVVAAATLDGTSMLLGDFAEYASLTVGGSYFCRVTAMDLDLTASAASEAVTFVYDTSVLAVDAGIKGAAVYLGGNLAYPGRPVGTTPLELRDLTPGSYVVAVEASGFELSLTAVTVDGLAAKNSVYAELQPAKQATAFKSAKAINGKTGLKVGAAAAPFVIDFDGDGKLDILTGDANGNVSLFRSIQVAGNGEMTVGPAEVVPALAGQVLPGAVPFVADWNNDDLNDLLIGLGDGTVKLFLNGGADALLQAGDVPLAVGSGAAPAVVDLDRDGRKDLVVGNAAGQVFACYNTGTDESPKLAAPVQLFTVGSPAVPSAIDRNADGVRELMVASAKGIAVYSNETGAYVATQLLATPAKAAFMVDADNAKGGDLILGAEDGRVRFAAASSFVYPATYPQALSAKVDEVEALMIVAEAATPELLAVVATIRGQVEAGSYAGAAVQAQNLEAALGDADAKMAASELAALCSAD